MNFLSFLSVQYRNAATEVVTALRVEHL